MKQTVVSHWVRQQNKDVFINWTVVHRLFYISVHLIRDDVTDDSRLRVQFQDHFYSVCSQNWTRGLSMFFCRYLGYRYTSWRNSGSCQNYRCCYDRITVCCYYRWGYHTSSKIKDGDAPFTTVGLNANGTLELKPRWSTVQHLLVFVGLHFLNCLLVWNRRKTRSFNSCKIKPFVFFYSEKCVSENIVSLYCNNFRKF